MNLCLALENLYWAAAKRIVPGGTDGNGEAKLPPVPGDGELVAECVFGGWFIFSASRLMEGGALVLRALKSMPREIRSSVSDKGIPWILCRQLEDEDVVLDAVTLSHVLGMARAMGFLTYLETDSLADIQLVHVDDLTLIRKEKLKSGKKWSALTHTWK